MFADVYLPLLADGLPAAAAELSDEENKEDSPQPPSRGDSTSHCYSSTNVQLSWHAPEGPSKTRPGCHQGWPSERTKSCGTRVVEAS